MNVRDSLLNALARSDEHYISGAQLADKLGVSRNAVWKAVKALESDGYIIESITGKGYRISPLSNKLSAEIIGNNLKTKSAGRKIILLDEAVSTNNTAKELAASGAEHGTAVIADSQTGGKGRLGRAFVSPQGTGLYTSIIIRPKISLETAQLITSCTACAAAEAVEAVCGNSVEIKWVNDLYMNEKKICGILTEASLSVESASLDYAIIGVGINVFSLKKLFSSELLETASSIEDECGIKINRNKLCAELFNRLETHLESIESRKFLADYRQREILTGNMITANVSGAPTVCRALGIDDNAALIIELPDGTVKTVNSGEATLCRIKK